MTSLFFFIKTAQDISLVPCWALVWLFGNHMLRYTWLMCGQGMFYLPDSPSGAERPEVPPEASSSCQECRCDCDLPSKIFLPPVLSSCRSGLPWDSEDLCLPH